MTTTLTNQRAAAPTRTYEIGPGGPPATMHVKARIGGAGQALASSVRGGGADE